jgi:hypothetical protein
MPSAGEAVATATANHVTFTADNFTWEEVVNVVTNCDDLTDELMTHYHGNWYGFLGPCIPFVNMKIGSADPGSIDANQNVVDTIFGNGDIFEPKARFSVPFYQCFHRLCHRSLSSVKAQKLSRYKSGSSNFAIDRKLSADHHPFQCILYWNCCSIW